MQIGETLESLSDLERLLRCTSEEAHNRISDVLWDAESDHFALVGLQKLANENLKEWETPHDGVLDETRLELLASG